MRRLLGAAAVVLVAAHVLVPAAHAGHPIPRPTPFHRALAHILGLRAPYFEVTAPAATRRPAGVALVIHGGAWHLVGPTMVRRMRPEARRLNAWGWTTVNIDYRVGRPSLTDVMSFYDAVVRVVGTRTRLCADGSSAGGTLAMLLAVRRPGLDCVIASAAPTLLGALGGTRPERGLRDRAIRFFGQVALPEWSPADQANRIRCPLLTAYATNDHLVPVTQGLALLRRRPATQMVVLRPGRALWVHSRVAARGEREWEGRERRFLAGAPA